MDHFGSAKDKLNEFMEVVASDFSYNPTTGDYNEFFNKGITDYYSGNLQEAPWIMAPVIYCIHQDLVYDGIEVAPVRKLSVSVLLSDPKDFEGGEFEMYGGFREPTKPLKEQGSIVVFDSRDYHGITPVTSGVRYSLVMWATGPLFK